MKGLTLAGILVAAVGVFILVRGLSYKSSDTVLEVGGLKASVEERRSVPTWVGIAAIVGGIAGGALLLAAYFVGVALVGAGIGALLVNVVWTQIEGDPHPAVVILFSIAGAVVATWLQRYVIILGTAFGGARGRTDVPKIVDWYMDKKINIDDLITHVMPLEKINDAFDLMHEGKSIRSVVKF